MRRPFDKEKMRADIRERFQREQCANEDHIVTQPMNVEPTNDTPA